MKLWQKNLMLLIIVLILTFTPIFVLNNADFSGSDDNGKALINQINSNYVVWVKPLFVPKSKPVENFILTIQAGIGGLIIGFGFGRLSKIWKSSL